jgi:hypothetical protein
MEQNIAIGVPKKLFRRNKCFAHLATAPAGSQSAKSAGRRQILPGLPSWFGGGQTHSITRSRGIGKSEAPAVTAHKPAIGLITASFLLQSTEPR